MNKRILAVDDDLAILEVLKEILEYYGYDVNTLSTGTTIFNKIDEFHPDLILLDIMLAGMDGREICKNLKQGTDTRLIPVILISATHDVKQSINNFGAPDDYLPKPFDISNLLNKVKHQLAA